MDVLTRRNRWDRQGTKKVRLTPRDLDIFGHLLRYRYLRADYAHAFVGGQLNRFQERMGDLWREPNCFVERAERNRRLYNADYRSMIYELDTNGERALRDYGMYDEDAPVAWLNRSREGHLTFPHSVMICEALANIEVGIRANPSLRFIPWSEIKRKMPEKVRHQKDNHCLPVSISHTIDGKLHHSSKALMPDAVFGIEYEGHGARFFALECDRNQEPTRRSNLEQTSYLRKLLQYRAVIEERTYKTQWGLPNLLVLNLTTAEVHKNSIMELALELFPGGSNYLLFNTMPSLGDFKLEKPTGRLLTQAWQRAGKSDFHLNQATER